MRAQEYRRLAAILMACLVLAVSIGADDVRPAKVPRPEKKSTIQAEGTTTPAAVGRMQPLNKQATVLLDTVGKRLLIKGHVCLRKGALELLCCLKQTKEHEAIISVDTKAYVVHAGLLALGAEQGKPVEFEPEYKSPTGQTIEIFIQWTDEKGQPQRVAAQNWIRYVTHRFYSEPLAKLPADVKLSEQLNEMRYDSKLKELIWYGPMSDEAKKSFLAMTRDEAFRKCIERIWERTQPKQMDARWVFSGSGYYEDEQTKEKFYRAEDGDLICVANFASATLDIATRSSNGADSLLFEAWTERIPEVGTPITMELIPVAKKPEESKQATKPVTQKVPPPPDKSQSD